MARLDRAHRLLELKLVYWGPAFGGKTTTLRTLHARCAERERGQLTSIETEQERTYFFDYAPLELPRFLGYAVRLHAFTVPGQAAYVETRRRILQGADVVVFVADATPSAAEATIESWIQLDDAMRALEPAGRPWPVVVTANKQDVPGATSPADVLRALTEAVPGRRTLEVHGTVATTGVGVVESFRRAATAGVERALDTSIASHPVEARRFLDELARVLGAPAAPEAKPPTPPATAPESAVPPPRRTVRVAAAPQGPDSASVTEALSTHVLLAARDLEMRELHQQQALGRLLIDLGHLCLSARSVDPMVRSVLSTLVMNLDASAGWVALPEPDAAAHVFDARGLCEAGRDVAAAIGPLLATAQAGRSQEVPPPVTARLPGAQPGAAGILVPFTGSGASAGWILLLGRAHVPMHASTASILSTTGAFLELASARLAALRQMQHANLELERRVEERTRELREEKEKLEDRVRERTSQLDAAKRATVEAERRLFDRERTEGVRRLAAGLAHEVNNPLAAIQANLQFVAESVGRVRALGGAAAVEAEDLASAVADASADVQRVSASVLSLFGGAAASRRSAHRTALGPLVRDTVTAFRQAMPEAPAPRFDEGEAVLVGLPPGEGARWTFRVLTLLAEGSRSALDLAIGVTGDGPTLTVASRDRADPRHEEELGRLARDVEACGGRLRIERLESGTRVRLVLPRALGESAHPAPAPREVAS